MGLGVVGVITHGGRDVLSVVDRRGNTSSLQPTHAAGVSNEQEGRSPFLAFPLAPDQLAVVLMPPMLACPATGQKTV